MINRYLSCLLLDFVAAIFSARQRSSPAMRPTPTSSRSSRRRLANATFPVDEEIEIRASLLRSNSLGIEALEYSLDQDSEHDAYDSFSNRVQRSPRCASSENSVHSSQTAPSLGVSQ